LLGASEIVSETWGKGVAKLEIAYFGFMPKGYCPSSQSILKENEEELASLPGTAGSCGWKWAAFTGES
jgi:hypothetical protein